MQSQGLLWQDSSKCSPKCNESLFFIALISVKYQDDVRICLDLFGQTKYDGKVIGMILSEFLCFKTVEMWSEACGPKIQEISRFYINTQRIKALK